MGRGPCRPNFFHFDFKTYRGPSRIPPSSRCTLCSTLERRTVQDGPESRCVRKNRGSDRPALTAVDVDKSTDGPERWSEGHGVTGRMVEYLMQSTLQHVRRSVRPTRVRYQPDIRARQDDPAPRPRHGNGLGPPSSSPYPFVERGYGTGLRGLLQISLHKG